VSKTSNVRVSIYYPSSDGATFDADYYAHSHMPLVREKLGDALLGDELWNGVDGPQPAPHKFVLHMYFESAESFQEAFAPHAKLLTDDVPNYTNIAPVIQVEKRT
jgi:uncharacterized protein (TIGR02118 family)